MTSPEETNAKVLEDIAALTQRCYGLLACIDAKGEVRGFEYICRVFREPRAGGVRVPVTFDGTLVNAVGGAHASAAHVPLPAASASASAHAAGLFGTPAPQGWGILGPQAAPFAFQAGQHLAWPAGGQVNGSRGVGLSASSVVEIDTPSLRLIECAVSRPSKVVLERAPPFNLGIEAVADIFNDKLDYTCCTFDDIRRIACGMAPIVSKFQLFGEAPNVSPTLRSFRANYERIVAGLDHCWALLQDAPSSSGVIQAKLEEANVALRAAAALGVHFVRNDRSQLPLDFNVEKALVCLCGRRGDIDDDNFVVVDVAGDPLIHCKGCSFSSRRSDFQNRGGTERANMAAD